MKILAMHATFGKLDGQTLTLEPGLNVITAPNEWGKSTWCAFLAAMLYGIDTRERSTMTALADKERYAPWSGKPMAGRMDIDWNGRRITLERSSKGRQLFGIFRAYETDTGLPVPELTGENCGLTLLGVEKNVFTRAGFVRQSDMPVTNDLALRRRLNELVTTGDETGASDKLAQTLKDLKNQCRHNRTGLLPQAEQQRNDLQNKLDQLQSAQVQSAQLQQQKAQLEAQLRQLETHKAALAYTQATENRARVAAAQAELENARQDQQLQENKTLGLPSREVAAERLSQLQALQQQWNDLQNTPSQDQPPCPAPFAGIPTETLEDRVARDLNALQDAEKPLSPLLPILSGIGLAGGIGLCFWDWRFALPLFAATLVAMGLWIIQSRRRKQQIATLQRAYGDLPPHRWQATADEYLQALRHHQETACRSGQAREALTRQTQAVTEGATIFQAMEHCRQTLDRWDTLDRARQRTQQAQHHAQALSAMMTDVPQPAEADTLTLTGEQTESRIRDVRWELQSLQERLGRLAGQLQSIGDGELMKLQLSQVEDRIARLEDTYAALTLAQDTLTEAANELQRRFAPKIAEKARDLFAAMTEGRYDRLILGQDLSLQAGAEGEPTLHETLWRSDGTVDQLYLSLRLAVAEALTPQAPLVLDDALCRFDDKRLVLAMDILRRESAHKQVLLFTCQERERELQK